MNKVESKFIHAASYYGDFTGLVAYHNVVSCRLLGATKVNNGVADWGFWRYDMSGSEEFSAAYQEMFRNISVYQVVSTRPRDIDGGTLEEVNVIWCTHCQQSVDQDHVCPSNTGDSETGGETGNNNDDFGGADTGNWGSSGGGSHSGGGGGGGYIIIDKICTPQTTLTEQQKLELDKKMEELWGKYCKAKELFDLLVEEGIKVTIKIDPQMEKGSVKYNKFTHVLTFFDISTPFGYGALEDFAHVAQCQYFYSGNFPSNRTLEFEAKMFCDFNCIIKGDDACALLHKGLMGSPLLIDYTLLLDKIRQTHQFDETDLELYYKLGENWNDPDYQSGTFERRKPLLLLYFF